MQPTDASIDGYIASRASEQQRDDCRALMSLLGAAVREHARMWGPSIVGFGSFRYGHGSGRPGEAPLAGFAIRGREIVLYLDCEDAAQQALLSRLGKHRVGKSCLYFRQLADLDTAVLEQVVAGSVADMMRRYG
jgi:hypothetical protein